MTFEWHEDIMVLRVFIFIFLFRANCNNGHLMIVFPKVPFWKLLDHSYVQSSFSTIVRSIENNILKDTLPVEDFTDKDKHTL